MIGTEQLMIISIVGMTNVAIFWFIAGIAVMKRAQDDPNKYGYH